ncbi:hypothetical protein C3747_62g187 [Trypanosoma cruzi]|uniref:Uncharacterized protein n=2 Tax=Trypanosoma cruzi TaxID=5693 RepID=Q4CRK5_TRYCC|nr:hypothetical protein, conserved [Trypanosoma cruzi]EAN82906.1 hypothetical protein, conserved [Trypanosoma cruzi]PWV11151.1 hypothetical protein C3747_62g187 [Trypanosoma cruzi]|eukprot:XP_804757.1 hypothetical protein [Trypanosoma cruzi strain CL Brener]
MAWVTATSSEEGKSKAPVSGATLSPTPLDRNEAADHNAGPRMSHNIHGSMASEGAPQSSHRAGEEEDHAILLPKPPLKPAPRQMENHESDTCATHGDSGVKLPEKKCNEMGSNGRLQSANNTLTATLRLNEGDLKAENNNDDDDDDEFGDFVGVTSRPVSEPVAIPEEPMLRRNEPLHAFINQQEKEHGHGIGGGKSESGQLNALTFHTVACASAEPRATTMGSSGCVCVDADRLDMINASPVVVKDEGAEEAEEYKHRETHVVEGRDDEGAENEREHHHNNQQQEEEDDEEEEWAAFTDAAVPPNPPLQKQLVTAGEATGISDMCVEEDTHATSSGRQFVFRRDMDIARIIRQLRELSGCVLDTEECNGCHDGGIEQQQSDTGSSSGEDRKGKQSRRELLLAVMDALSFRRRDSVNRVGETPPVGGGPCVTSGSLAFHCNPLGTPPCIGEGCEKRHDTPQPQPQLPDQASATLDGIIDPFAPLRLAERHTTQRREQLESVLLQASRVRQRAIPVCEAITKVRNLAMEYEQEKQKEQQTSDKEKESTWHIHPTLPTPCIGGNLFPAFSLRLPF